MQRNSKQWNETTRERKKGEREKEMSEMKRSVKRLVRAAAVPMFQVKQRREEKRYRQQTSKKKQSQTERREKIASSRRGIAEGSVCSSAAAAVNSIWQLSETVCVEFNELADLE